MNVRDSSWSQGNNQGACSAIVVGHNRNMKVQESRKESVKPVFIDNRGVLSTRERFEQAMREDPFNLSPDLLYPIMPLSRPGLGAKKIFCALHGNGAILQTMKKAAFLSKRWSASGRNLSTHLNHCRRSIWRIST